MSVLIKGITKDYLVNDIFRWARYGANNSMIGVNLEVVELPDHGDLIDRDAFRKTMYHDTFETDSDLQKWESGCWIRYKMFERNIESAPVVIPAERE